MVVMVARPAGARTALTLGGMPAMPGDMAAVGTEAVTAAVETDGAIWEDRPDSFQKVSSTPNRTRRGAP